MRSHIRYKSFDQLSFIDLSVYTRLPDHPFWSNLENEIDFSFADRLCEVLYSGRGQYPYAPSLKLKIHLIQVYYDLSDRQVEEKIMGDLFIKRFLRLPVDFFGFDHSTIGLDRSRMGESLLHACHLYILAQMYSKGLWGEDHNEQWIIDSFPSNIGMTRHGAFRLIQHAMIRVVQHLKRHAPSSVKSACQSLPLDALMTRLTSDSTPKDCVLAFSKLVAQAYGLLHWFENDTVTPLLSEWKEYAKSQELQTILRQVLTENSRPKHPDAEENSVESTPSSSKPETPESGQASTMVSNEVSADTAEPEEIEYEKIPREERPADRIESAIDTQARTGVKSKSKVIVGYKIQNLCTTEGVILGAKVIPANELDGEAMLEMVNVVRNFFHHSPQAVIGDAAYGLGRLRALLDGEGVKITAPLPVSTNPTKLYPITSFHYDPQEDQFTCLNGAKTIRKNHNPNLEGAQYFFGKENCLDCPLRSQCTTNRNGRTVFRSDYANYYEAAKVFNESAVGKESFKKRYTVERKNNELKNDCGLGQPKTKSRRSLQMKAILAGIVVNLKYVVRVRVKPKPGFLRRVQIT